MGKRSRLPGSLLAPVALALRPRLRLAAPTMAREANSFDDMVQVSGMWGCRDVGGWDRGENVRVLDERTAFVPDRLGNFILGSLIVAECRHISDFCASKCLVL